MGVTHELLQNCPQCKITAQLLLSLSLHGLLLWLYATFTVLVGHVGKK